MITVRPYRAADSDACWDLFFRAVREGTAGIYDETQRQDWAPDWDPDAPDDGEDKLLAQACWVSEKDNRITGFMSLTREGYLDMAFVLPEVMGKGHAAAIYDQLLAHALTARLPRLTVDASHFSRRFLERRGWQVDDVEDFVSPSGVHFERFNMSLALASLPA
ncbi:MAG: GNAT family N-acetyltransferase [Tabrizicola sp.]|nr:GNAT family N-acetyltransferase [Tabrizicola sp.]